MMPDALGKRISRKLRGRPQPRKDQFLALQRGGKPRLRASRAREKAGASVRRGLWWFSALLATLERGGGHAAQGGM